MDAVDANAGSVGGRWGGRRIGAAVVVVVALVALVAGVALRGGAAAGSPGSGLAPSASRGQALTPDGYGAGQFQVVPGDQPSVVVLGNGEASAAAESATMQVILRALDGGFLPPPSDVPQQEPAAPPAPPTLTAEQVQSVVDAIVAAGMPEAATEVVISPPFGGAFGPGSALVVVEVGAEELPLMADAATAAVEAARENGILLETVNAAYAVADCAPLLREARQAAADNAREQADGLAEVLGVTLGEIVLASEVPVYGGFPGSGCPPATPGAELSGKGTYLPPFDPTAPAEVEVYSQLNLAYAIG